MTSLLDYALYYAKRGWRVLPLHNVLEDGRCSCRQDCGKNHSKHPRINDWPTEATTNEDIIREWWTFWPNANVGIAMGVDSNLLGIDIDVKTCPGDQEFTKLENKHGVVGDLPIVRTPTGGYHLYFTCPRFFKNGTNVVPGVDVRAEGGLLVAPPSITPKGSYTWATELEAEPIPPPQWLIDLLTEHHKGKPEIPDIVREGGRNDVMTSIAGAIRRRGLCREAIEAALIAENKKRCNPPLPDREIKIIARSIARYEADDPILAKVGVKEEPWDTPKPFNAHTLPLFPVETLPAWLQNFCRGMARETQTPIDLPAMFALTILSATVAKKYRVHLQHGWYQPLNVYNIVVMRSGGGKSPVFSEALKPLGDYEQKLCSENKLEIEHQNIEIQIKEAEREKLIKDHTKAGNDVEKGMLHGRIQELTLELVNLERLTKPQLVAEDVTAEALTSAIFRNSGRIAVLSDEGDGVLENMSGRYSKNGSPNFDIYLKGHSGEPLRVDRIGRPAEYIQSPALTVGLGVQPSVLQGMWLKPGFSGKGLLARFWYFIPPDKLGNRNQRIETISDSFKHVFYCNIIKMLQEEWDGELNRDTFECHPRVLRLTKEAHELWLQFCEWIEPQLQPMGRLGELSDWGGKFAGITGRYAALLHLADFVHDFEDAHRSRVSIQTMERSIALSKYALEHSLAAFAEMRTDTVTADAKKIINGIKKYRWMDFTRTDVIVKLNFRSNILDNALSLLMDYQYIREAGEEQERRKGRPARKYVVNPSLFEESLQ